MEKECKNGAAGISLEEDSAKIAEWLQPPEKEHEPGCPAIADDESDYEYLDDAGHCTCNIRSEPKKPIPGGPQDHEEEEV